MKAKKATTSAEKSTARSTKSADTKEVRKSYAYVAGVCDGFGNFVTRKQLDEAGLDVVLSGFGDADKVANVRKSIVSKANHSGVPKSSSKEIQRSNFQLFGSADVLNSPYDFDVLGRLYTSCEVHSSCVNIKSGDYAYHGWELVPRPELAEMNIPEEDLEAAHEEVTSFLRSCSDNVLPIEDLIRAIAIDWEGLGTCGFEIVRDKRGFISYLNHIPFSTMGVLDTYLRKEEKKPSAFIQKRYDEEVFFVPFGHNIKYSKENFDPCSAKLADFPPFKKRQGAISWNTNELVKSRPRDAKCNDLRDVATEFYIFGRPPKMESTVFGTPSAIAAYSAMLADMRAEQYNLNFFTSGGVPYFAIIFKNMTPQSAGEGDTEGDYSSEAALEAYLQEFFAKHLTGQARGTLVLQMFGDAEVEFQRLSPESLEASFLEYREKAADRIRMAHEVPPAALGMERSNNLGTNSTRSQLTRYRDHVVSPGQRAFEAIVNQIIRCGLLIPYFDFRFKTMPVEDEVERQKFVLDEYEKGAITPNEYRVETGRPPFTSPKAGDDLADTLIIRNAQIAVVHRSGDVETTLPGQELHPVAGPKRITTGSASSNEEKDDEEETV